MKVSRLPAALAYGLIRRRCGPANLANARYAMAAWRARPAADKGWPGDQARPRGLKPRAAAAATARRVPSQGAIRVATRCPILTFTAPAAGVHGCLRGLRSIYDTGVLLRIIVALSLANARPL